MSINGCKKGKAGEREFRDVLREEGFEAKRGQQHAGGVDSPDVVCPALAHLHFEVKRVEALNVGKAMAQAVRDAGGVKLPVVAHRKNRDKDWLITMRSRDWFKLLRDALSLSPMIDPNAAEAARLTRDIGIGLTPLEYMNTQLLAAPSPDSAAIAKTVQSLGGEVRLIKPI